MHLLYLERHKGIKMEITFEQINELYNFLANGELPGGMIMPSRPKLGKNKAFNVIWFLQEHLKILPDKYEQCCRCKDIYDTWSEGEYIEKSDRHYCDACIPNKYKI